MKQSCPDKLKIGHLAVLILIWDMVAHSKLKKADALRIVAKAKLNKKVKSPVVRRFSQFEGTKYLIFGSVAPVSEQNERR